MGERAERSPERVVGAAKKAKFFCWCGHFAGAVGQRPRLATPSTRRRVQVAAAGRTRATVAAAKRVRRTSVSRLVGPRSASRSRGAGYRCARKLRARAPP